MIIGFNGRFLLQPFTGIGKHSIQLLLQLAHDYLEVIFVVIIPEALSREVASQFTHCPNIQFHIRPESSFLRKLHKGLAKTFWERRQLAEVFRKEKVDVIHIPYPSAFRRTNTPLCVTIHDVIPWVLHEYRQRGYLSSVYNNLALHESLRADVIFTVSEFSKKELLRFTDVAEEKIIVTPNACDKRFIARSSQKEKQETLLKYKLPLEKKFLFYLGGFDQRKNVERLVEIFSRFIAPQSDLNLVIGGERLFENQLYNSFEKAKKVKFKERIHFTGAIEESDLPKLFQSAWAFIHLTSYEGFNMPLLEALSSGTVCIASHIPPHLEIDGDSIYFINLKNTDEALAEKILLLQSDGSVYAKTKARTEMFISHFSWKKTAERVFAAYQKF